MTDINNQIDYWNKVAREKEFTHPVNMPLLRTHISLSSKILDYGCGYGRVCQKLAEAGYVNIIGVDSSAEMIRRGREQYPGLSLEVLSGSGLDYPACSFDAVLLIAVLTCIPTDTGQKSLLNELTRILRPKGMIYISDYVLQDDERNQQRYQQNAEEFGVYGVFRLPEGTVVRHHSIDWIHTLTSGFETLDLVYPEVVTMNGHKAKAFQYLGIKREISPS
ncbi:MAG: class I SAM-dependent methyltransferase [Anaerolineales bacterium]